MVGRSWVIVAIAVFAGPVRAADVPVETRIDAVMVFPAGAEVTRTGRVRLDQGEHVLIVDDLTDTADPGSIRVEGKASAALAIGAVDTRRTLVLRSDAAQSQSERRRLEDQLAALRDQRAGQEAIVQAAETQKTLVANLAQLPLRAAPSGAGAPPEDWRQILALISAGTVDAHRTSLDAQVKMRSMDHEIMDLEKRLSQLAPTEDARTEVKINVQAAAALDADIVVRYRVDNASWFASYDARLNTGTKTDAPRLDLTRHAAVTQNTGETWDDVAMQLSTARPSAGSAAPQLDTVTVDFEPPPRPVAAAAPPAGIGRQRSDEPMAEAMAPEAAADADFKVATTAQSATMIAAPFQAVFAVPGRVTVPTTQETKRVQLAVDTLEPALGIRAVPKLEPAAYLYAKFAVPKGAPLLAGSVALFRDQTFVGTGDIPVLSPGEEHELGFGIDDLVRIKHAVVEERRGETGLISSSRTDERNYRLTAKNMHERAMPVTILDQIPASQNEAIKVELTGRTAPSKTNIDDKRGVIAWDTKLEPDEERVIEFGYRVTWPADKPIRYGP